MGWLTPTEFVLGSIEPYGTPRDLTRVNLISAEAGAIFLSQAGGQTSAPRKPSGRKPLNRGPGGTSAYEETIRTESQPMIGLPSFVIPVSTPTVSPVWKPVARVLK